MAKPLRHHASNLQQNSIASESAGNSSLQLVILGRFYKEKLNKVCHNSNEQSIAQHRARLGFSDHLPFA
ncbi:hypothetical protein ACQRIU_002447 [Beauveria bassiana]